MKLFLVSTVWHDLFVFADNREEAIGIASEYQSERSQRGLITIDDEFGCVPGVVYRIPPGEGSR